MDRAGTRSQSGWPASSDVVADKGRDEWIAFECASQRDVRLWARTAVQLAKNVA